MLTTLKERARRSKSAVIAYKIFDSWRRRRRHVRGDILDAGGATHLGRPLEASVARIFGQFENYVAYGDLSPQWLAGRRVLEVGYGDNVGVALLFLAAGAGSAVCLDRFYCPRDDEQQRQIYLGVRARLGSEEERRRFDDAIDLSAGVKTNPERLRELHGAAVEDSEELRKVEPFDLAVSNAAVQEIYDPTPTFEALDRVLKPGGLSIHKIDLTDYGVFSGAGLNPLTFLTIGEPVYRLMAAGECVVNRKMVNFYRDLMRRLGYDAKFYVTEVIGRGRKGDMRARRERPLAGVDYTEETLALVREIRPRLSEGFRNLPDEDLLVAGTFMVARKPSGEERV
ncbi:MAG: methyltransferase domain-containing protein [Pyrinomonadaceae bacterium]